MMRENRSPGADKTIRVYGLHLQLAQIQLLLLNLMLILTPLAEVMV
jgi:hypothetical protein